MNPSDQARQIGVVDSWLAQYLVMGNVTNPGNLTVICDLGQMPAGYYDVEVGVEVSAAMGIDNCIIQFRNAANNDSIFQFMFYSAGVDRELYHFFNIKMAADERMRVFTYATVQGRIDAHIRAVRRA